MAGKPGCHGGISQGHTEGVGACGWEEDDARLCAVNATEAATRIKANS